MVAEGYIHEGPNALPPYVILTKSIEYSSSIGLDALNDLFVHDAQVTISDGTNTVALQELCVSDLQMLPPFLQDAITQSLGIPSVDSIDFGTARSSLRQDFLQVRLFFRPSIPDKLMMF